MERVVVTGVGLVTPLGVGTETSWKALAAGQSGAAPITLFEHDDRYPTRFACEVKGYDPAEFMPRKKVKEVCRFITFAMGASKLAIADA